MASKSEGNWCLIESDPGVFTEIIKQFGVSGIECEEIIDIDYMSSLNQTYGLVFLYKWQQEDCKSPNVVTDSNVLSQIFFAKQVITNACATQALLNILFNLEKDINLGNTLTSLKEFCASFDPHMKGLTISNSEEIRKVHNSFSNNTLYELEDHRQHSSEESYHFIAYMPINNRIYELDGLQDGPIEIGLIPEGASWIDVVKPVLTNRMLKHADTYFNVMALIPDKLESLEKQLKVLQDSNVSDDKMVEVMAALQEEKLKHERYRIENIRRKHNYMPFIIELMKILAEEGRLSALVEKAEEMAVNKRKRKLENTRRMEIE